jgi:putative hemolysin
MKKFLSLLLFLILIIGVVIYFGEQGQIKIQDKTPLRFVQDLVEPYFSSEDDVKDLKEPDSSGFVDPITLYCADQGGEIGVEERDGKNIKTCFINDGKDGILCDAVLFFEKTCGHGDPDEKEEKEDPVSESETEDVLQIFLNQDPTSDIDLVVIAPNGEGATAFTKDVDGTEILEKVVIVSADGKSGLIEVDEQARPTRFSFDDTVITYTNYTEDSVDVSVSYPDGTKSDNEKQTLETAFQNNGILNLLVPYAKANWITDLACTGDDCFYNTFPSLGTSLNVVFCGITLGNTLFTAGATAPLAYLSCASLATRVATMNTEIGPCKGDVLECGKDTVFDFVKQHGPKTFREGVSLTGFLKNEITGTKIEVATLGAKHLRSGKTFRGDNDQGAYSMDITGTGVTTMKIVAEGFKDEELIVAATNAKIMVKSVTSQVAREFSLPYEGYVDLTLDLTLEPDGYISGEVIESENAEPVSLAFVRLLDGTTAVDTFETDGDGTFNLQPSLFNNEHNFVLEVSHPDYQTFSKNLSVTFDIAKNSDQYEITDWSGVVKLQPLEEEEELSGAIQIPITFHFVHTGITHEGTGTLSLSDKARNSTCSVSLDGKAFGIPEIPAELAGDIPDGFEIPAIEGSYSGKSTTCTGEVSYGQIYLSGKIFGKVDFNAAGENFSDEDTLPFAVNGQIKDGQASGSIVIDEISTIPF